MTVSIHDSCEPLAEIDLDSLEQQLGLDLPNDYRSFLLSTNGGYPVPNGFAIPDNPVDEHGLVHYFLCIDNDDVYNLMDWAERYKDRIPEGLVPIATDPGGNLICLSATGASSGNVFFWEHEREADEGQAPRQDNVYLVADSFQRFIDNLVDIEAS